MKLDAPWLSSPDIQTLGAAFAAAGFELRFVGGCVRDTILGRPFTEVDAATNATPEQVMVLLEKAHIRAIPTGLKHGTVTALVNDKPYEITTLRKDVATDGRHAEVAYTDSWEEDAQRRDFTMNALYLDLMGNLYDYAGGMNDCKARKVRFIGNADARIKEDYLRILRYFRFVATVGGGQLDEAALAACTANKAGIDTLSGERIAQELLKLLACNDAAMSVEKLLPLPPPLSFPRRRESIPIMRLDSYACGKDADLLKLAALIADIQDIPPIATRLKLSNKQKDALHLWLTHAPLISPSMSELAQKKLVRKLGAENYVAAAQLAAALSDAAWKDYEPLLAMANWTPPVFPITARDLMAQGYKEGKELGDKLRALEAEWEDSGYSQVI